LKHFYSAILAILQTELGWPCTVSVALNNSSQDFKNSFFFALGADKFLAMLEGKFILTPFFKVQSGKITVCH
jgi:hypothetical protein